MLEFSEEIPFLWRLSAESGEGFSLVSMVVPFQTGSQNHEHTIQTDVISFSGDHEKLSEEETLEWNEEDIQLFLKLLAVRNGGHIQPIPPNTTQTFKVDLNDPDTIEIVNIVAAAGFGMTLTVDDLLVADPGDKASPILKQACRSHCILLTVTNGASWSALRKMKWFVYCLMASNWARRDCSWIRYWPVCRILPISMCMIW